MRFPLSLIADLQALGRSRRSSTVLSFALLLLLLAISGALQGLVAALMVVMAEHPLPRWYFLIFISLGSVLPLIWRLRARRQALVRRILDPYLIVLAGQMLSEILLVLLAGKGMGVVVGFCFTVVRLAQILTLRPLALGARGMLMLLNLELVLWSFNLGHILLRRFLPLLRELYGVS